MDEINRLKLAVMVSASMMLFSARDDIINFPKEYRDDPVKAILNGISIPTGIAKGILGTISGTCFEIVISARDGKKKVDRLKFILILFISILAFFSLFAADIYFDLIIPFNASKNLMLAVDYSGLGLDLSSRINLFYMFFLWLIIMAFISVKRVFSKNTFA